jgi:hypothetical protein
MESCQPIKRLKDKKKVRSQNCEKQLLASEYLPVRPSVLMEQLGSHWTDFNGI